VLGRALVVEFTLCRLSPVLSLNVVPVDADRSSGGFLFIADLRGPAGVVGRLGTAGSEGAVDVVRLSFRLRGCDVEYCGW